MPKRLNDQADVRVAVAASAGAALPLIGISIDGTGYSRARFVFNFGNKGATTGSISAGVGVWQASTSGATSALIAGASLAAVTSGVISGATPVMVIDVPISAGTPWLLVSGSVTSTAIPHACVVELYDGINRPPSSSTQQLVVV